jgi:hypothetical protein
MEQLVLTKLHEHSSKLDHLQDDINAVKIKIGILTDREDRELAAAKSIAVRWGTSVGALISTIIGALWAFFRDP